MGDYVEDFQIGKNKYIDKIAIESKRICIIFGPNGAGKDTIRDLLVKDEDKIGFIRTTTRKIAKGEISDIHYHYLESSDNNFQELRNKALLSYKFHDNYYWEDAYELYNTLENNPDSFVLLIMGSALGVSYMKKILKESKAFCIIPTSYECSALDECISRIKNRNREDTVRMNERISIITDEIELTKNIADYVIENPRGNPMIAVNKIRNIISKLKSNS